MQFEGVGDNGIVDLSKVLGNSGIKAASWNDGDCFNGKSAEIQVRQPGGNYLHYYYISDGTDLNDDDLGYDCWCDIDGYPPQESDLIGLGNGVWLIVPEAAKLSGETPTIQVSGEVYAQDTLGVTVLGNLSWNMSGNPWPIALDVNKVDLTGFKAGSWNAGDCFNGKCSEIQIRELGGNYLHYYYISDGTDLNDDDLGYDCWCDIDGYPPESTIATSLEGFWFKILDDKASVTIPFKK